MKKNLNFILGLLMLCIAGKSYAQSDTASFIERYDIYTENIDKGQIPYGVLYNRVLPHSQLNYTYSNPEAGEEIFYDFEHWKQAYYELYLSTYDREPLSPLEYISNSTFNDYYNNKIINVGVINYNYSYIDSNAISNNLFEEIEEYNTPQSLDQKFNFLS